MNREGLTTNSIHSQTHHHLVIRRTALILILFVINLLAAACSETFDEKLDFAQFTVERQGVANYRVKIEIPEGQTLSIYRKSPFTQESTIIATNRSDILFDETPQSGELYRYVVGVGSGDEFEELYKTDVKIPLDIISSQLSKLPQHYFQTKIDASTKEFETEIEAMVLDKGFPFYLNGAKSQLIIKKLISNGGEIATFVPGAKAEAGVNGSSGGPLRIKILSGEGEIKFTMRGQHAGDGIEPEALGEEARSATGASGQLGKELKVTWVQSGSSQTSCLQQPTSGGKGEKGQTGRPGAQGMRGGDSGELHVEFGPDAQVSYSVEKHTGSGGQGSQGGIGGPGGRGGLPGELEKTEVFNQTPKGQPLRKTASRQGCAEVTEGAEGERGDRGPSGPVGVDGIISKSCVKTFDQVAETCEL